MAAKVYANGMEVSGKASSHKVLGSMPDVCLSPPSPPAGPIPLPYPNFAQASDTTGGSKKVKVGEKEADLKGKSKYKKCKGDEAATRSFGSSVLSHTITGAVKYVAGSFDVKVEGSNVVRNLDLTTGNHSNSTTGSVAPGGAGVAPPATSEEECKELLIKNKEERDRLKEAGHKRDSSIEHKTVRKAAGRTTTISHAIFKGGGEILKAASKAVIHKYDNSFSEGLTSEEINANKNSKTVDSKACGGHKYKKVARPHTSHTESRIIETIFSQAPIPQGSSLVLAINWPGGSKAGKSRYEPCDHCKALICAATECLNITICRGKKQDNAKDKCP